MAGGRPRGGRVQYDAPPRPDGGGRVLRLPDRRLLGDDSPDGRHADGRLREDDPRRSRRRRDGRRRATGGPARRRGSGAGAGARRVAIGRQADAAGLRPISRRRALRRRTRGRARAQRDVQVCTRARHGRADALGVVPADSRLRRPLRSQTSDDRLCSPCEPGSGQLCIVL